MDSGQQDTQATWRGRAYKVWTLIGVCILIAIVVRVCGIIWQAVAVVIVTALLVFLLHGVVNQLEARHVPRWAATTLCFVALIAIIAGCIVALIPAVVSQLASLANHLPGYVSQLQDFLAANDQIPWLDAGDVIDDALASFTSWFSERAGQIVSSLAGGVIGSIIGIGNVLLIAFISLVCAFWILLDLPKLSHEVRALFPERLQDDIDVFADAFGNAVYGWAKSTLVCAVITGVASYVIYLALGIPYAAMLGLVCGVLYFIPYLGPIVSCIAVGIIALFVSPIACVVSVVLTIVLHNVIANIISPRLMKSSMSVHPVLILIAILVGSALGGVAGMLLSIPVIGALQGVFVTYFEAHTGKTIATEDGVLFHKKARTERSALDPDEEEEAR